jgi:hypothetical protein
MKHGRNPMIQDSSTVLHWNARSDGSRVKRTRYAPPSRQARELAEDQKSTGVTNLCNERPTWLDLAHRKLDEAVFAAYGWDPSMSDEEILAKLLGLNLQKAGV